MLRAHMIVPGILALCCASSPLLAQDDASSTLAEGDRFMQADVGFSWYSPRGGGWGLITNRRVYLTAVRSEWIIEAQGRLAWAYTVEWVPLAVVERTIPRQTMRCYPTGSGGRCEVDRSARVAVGTGLAPIGIKSYLNTSGNARLFANGSAGVIAFSSHVPVHASRRLNFMLDYGGGVELVGRDGRAFTIGYRFHHVSNAGSARVNPGLDANVIYVGVRRKR